MDYSPGTRRLYPWNFPGKNTGAGCHFLFQGISPTQGLDLNLLGLLQRHADSLSLRHLGSPSEKLGYNISIQLTEFLYCCCLVAKSCPTLQLRGLQHARLLCPWHFPGKNTGAGCHFLHKGFSQPRDRTCISCISCIGRQILYHCATWVGSNFADV